MSTVEDVAKLVHNEHMSSDSVIPGPSHSQRVIILEVKNGMGVVPLVDQELFGQVVRELLQGWGEILTHSVVHVKPIAMDLRQIQVPIDKDTLLLQLILKCRAPRRTVITVKRILYLSVIPILCVLTC